MPKNVNGKNRRIKGGFLAIPHDVLRSACYRRLTPYAVKLLVDIAGQYNGKNNGNLCASMSVLRPMGWASTATLNRARRELISAGMIEQTRQGGMNLGPNLYAITWQKIDECKDARGRPRHDATPTNRPSGLWKQSSQPA